MKKNDLMVVNVVHTDTFGGDANGSWMKRYSFLCSSKVTTRSLVLKAKKLSGLTNHKSSTHDYGSEMTIKPAGLNQILILSFE